TDLSSASPLPQLPLLRQILEEARAAGFLGPGPVDAHLRHAEGFVAVCRRLWPDGPTPPVILDLGSGGGLPGLVVATRLPEATLVLLDAQARRTAFLSDVVRRLGLGDRVSVRQDRAEAAGRDPGARGHFDGVLARSFGRPAVVAECAAPLLKPGGWLVVSEPPGGSPEDPPDSPSDPPRTARWPAEPLRQLGLVPDRLLHEASDYQTLRQVDPCPDRFPRRDGMPAKRPLY
ncbi:MAG TPA: RsmG family class I SAM-dependent methyltransferase, partial [Acidimicrobiales bacterium]